MVYSVLITDRQKNNEAKKQQGTKGRGNKGIRIEWSVRNNRSLLSLIFPPLFSFTLDTLIIQSIFFVFPQQEERQKSIIFKIVSQSFKGDLIEATQ
jgi:hypothetical protein